jgi:hypothetical protein
MRGVEQSMAATQAASPAVDKLACLPPFFEHSKLECKTRTHPTSQALLSEREVRLTLASLHALGRGHVLLAFVTIQRVTRQHNRDFKSFLEGSVTWLRLEIVVSTA